MVAPARGAFFGFGGEKKSPRHEGASGARPTYLDEDGLPSIWRCDGDVAPGGTTINVRAITHPSLLIGLNRKKGTRDYAAAAIAGA
jgi:hypothetical protein